MNGFSRTIKEWAGCVIAIGLVVGAATYTLVRGARVGSDIRLLRTAADTLNTTAQQAPTDVIDAGEIDALSRTREDLEARRRDASKHGLVVSQLSEEARRCGLEVVEIQPRVVHGVENRYPQFRVSVVGGYERIARYMDGCKRQRIPARVVEFAMMPVSSDAGEAVPPLRAEITVEAYSPVVRVEKEEADGQA